MSILRVVCVLIALVFSSAVAEAQQFYCKRQGQYDPAATQTLQQMLSRSDRQLMGALAGTWYAEIRSPQTNQVSFMYTSYDPNSGFEYQNRVCNGQGAMCSDYQGGGVYAGVQLGGGQFTLMLMVSDNSRDHECSGSNGRFVGNGMIQDSNGQTWRKVR